MLISILCIYAVSIVYVQYRGVWRYTKLSRLLNDHTNIFAPLNCLFYLFSAVPNTPFLNKHYFSELNELEKRWLDIKQEAIAILNSGVLRERGHHEDIGFHSFYKRGWKKFGLFWYGVKSPSAQEHCPKTIALLEQFECVRGAMITSIPPHSNLMVHRDPFAGSLRYQLALQTCGDMRCHIKVDDERYCWKEGEAVIFDETYIHTATNDSDVERIVLMLDLRRPFKWVLVTWVSTLFEKMFLRFTYSKNNEQDALGPINWLVWKLYPIRTFGKAVKSWSQPVYYGIQYALIISIIALLVRQAVF